VAPKVEEQQQQQQQQKDDDLQLISIEDENTENLSEHEKSDSEQEKDCPTRPESDKSDSDSEGVKETTVKTTEETASIVEPHSALPNAMEESISAAGDSIPVASPPKVRRSAGERRPTGHTAAAVVDKNSRREKSAEKPAPLVPATPASKGAGKAAAVVSVTASPSVATTGTGTPAKRSFASTVKNTVPAAAATSAGVKMCSSAAFGRADTTAGGSQRPRMTRALTTIGTAPTVAKVPSVSRRSQVMN
jgi:hypothetical protein